MNLPKITEIDVINKKVLLRLDLDTSSDPNDLRVKSSYETLDYLKNKASKITILAHKGRPDGKVDERLSLNPFQSIFDKWGATVLENLRFDSREMKNDPEFAKELALLGDVYINDSFAESHRNAVSIVGLPKLLPHAAGFRFEKEVNNLSKVFDPVRPLVILISGVKKDKLEMIEPLSNLADKVLVGGRLPDFLGDNTISVRSQTGKVIVGNLVMDKEDITVNTIEKFKEEIAKAKTIVLAGVLGKYEDEGHSQGTKAIFEAVGNSNAFKIVGGGDSLIAIEKYNLTDKFDWISVGGGACLEFLINKTLPGIEALLH